MMSLQNNFDASVELGASVFETTVAQLGWGGVGGVWGGVSPNTPKTRPSRENAAAFCSGGLGWGGWGLCRAPFSEKRTHTKEKSKKANTVSRVVFFWKRTPPTPPRGHKRASGGFFVGWGLSREPHPNATQPHPDSRLVSQSVGLLFGALGVGVPLWRSALRGAVRGAPSVGRRGRSGASRTRRRALGHAAAERTRATTAEAQNEPSATPGTGQQPTQHKASARRAAVLGFACCLVSVLCCLLAHSLALVALLGAPLAGERPFGRVSPNIIWRSATGVAGRANELMTWLELTGSTSSGICSGSSL